MHGTEAMMVPVNLTPLDASVCQNSGEPRASMCTCALAHGVVREMPDTPELNLTHYLESSEKQRTAANQYQQPPRWDACFSFQVGCCLQGGGIYIAGSSTQVQFQNCNIYENEAYYVSVCLSHPNASWNDFSKGGFPDRM